MKDKHSIVILTWCIVCNGVVAMENDFFNCTFDDGLCNWIPVISNYSKLAWGRQSSSSSKIGPYSDHTSGVGNFIYINSSNELQNMRARLSSHWLESPGKYCLSFWYYMYGRDTDILWIAVKEEGKSPKGLFYKTKAQRKMWRFKTTKIFIQGTIKIDTADFGYIAVDDVMMFPEECPKHCSDPTPAFGNPAVGDVWEGSIVNIVCREGYEIKGNSTIVCQNSEKWSNTPTCQPVDCGKPQLGKGMLNTTFEKTTFNTTITLSCSRGFTLIGNSSITCMANRTWSTLPRCVINNCNDPTPESGNVNSTDFKVGSVVQITCTTGYKLIGDSQISCQINSTWNDNPLCERIKCFRPILTKGLLEPNGTIWYSNQFVLLTCTDGNTLKGNAKIICQESGNWTTLPTCDYNDESVSGDLIAVAVTVPLLAICIIVIITVAVFRKRTFWCMEGDKTREQDMNRQTQLPHNIYGNSGLNTDPCTGDESLGQDTVYAVISKKNPPKMKDVVYNNTLKYGADVINNADYDHMKMSFESVLDNTYSKIQDNNIDSRNKPGKNSTDSYSYTNAAFQEVDDEYNNINLNRPSESVKQNTSVSINTYQEHESEYDHAKAGGCDSNTLDLDEYSHLNKAVVGHKDRLAKTSNLSLDNPVRIEQEIETEYGESTDDTQIYFNVEKEEDSYTQEEDRYEIVSENEKKNVEYFNEDQHDYFILEKSE